MRSLLSTPRPKPRPGRVLAGAVAMALMLAACGDDEGSPAEGSADGDESEELSEAIDEDDVSDEELAEADELLDEPDGGLEIPDDFPSQLLPADDAPATQSLDAAGGGSRRVEITFASVESMEDSVDHYASEIASNFVIVEEQLGGAEGTIWPGAEAEWVFSGDDWWAEGRIILFDGQAMQEMDASDDSWDDAPTGIRVQLHED